MPLTPEQQRTLATMQNKMKEFRGTIIDSTVKIEKILANTIAHYFCKDEDRVLQLMESLLYTENFSRLIETFNYVMDTAFIDMLQQHPQLKNNIEAVRTMRNAMAHYNLDTSEDVLNTFNGTYTLLYVRGGTQRQKQVTVATMNEHVILTNGLLTTLIQIEELARAR